MQRQSRITTTAKVLLVLGGTATVAMAGYHFFLPAIFGWAGETTTLLPAIRWGVFSMNLFFSCLLLALGMTTLAGVLMHRTNEGTYLAVLLTGALFWLVNGCYQLLIPMPLPGSYALLGYFLRSFAFGVAALYLIPLVSLIRKRNSV